MTHQLSEAQEKHLADMKADIVAHIDAKYRRGAAEHTGNLWDCSPSTVLKHALDEVIDLLTYLQTLRQLTNDTTAGSDLLVRQLSGFLTHPPLKLHHKGDVGYDLYACMNTEINIAPHDFADIPCGIAIKLPPNTWGMIHSRSSTFWKRRLIVHAGIIDNGYTGPLKIGVWNPTTIVRSVHPYESLAQLIILPITPLQEVIVVDELPATSRGDKGFGSTGGV
jgi:dUTP pyrophosphatase